MSLLDRSRARVIIDAVALRHKLSGYELEGRSREAKVTKARWLAMYVLYEGMHMPKAEVGRLLHRDHSTVINGLRQVEADRALQEKARQLILDLCPEVVQLPGDVELRNYLTELDALLDRGRTLRRMLAAACGLSGQSLAPQRMVGENAS